ncbi:stage III sporulation protein SpoIIIAB [Paenibacillus sediminis]|uniref:Stage III sporulation protein AB n=1 Tax=Paenibacillus sediminis TaxID=664909 RepID=A0ABS4H0K5_9BACL|nr:stage III sporulation protein SpoIIIAB [Paenibacillus sediminis]MBP1935650.1 stage III sporulation protein AB [Paenibacillus sediminis]
MLKFIGAALILLAGTSAGMLKAQQFAGRPKQIRDLILALKRLGTEISYGFTPLPDALNRISKQMKEPLHTLFLQASQLMNHPSQMTAQDCIHEAIRSNWHNTAMKSAERDVLYQLGYNLGVSDRQDQMNYISLAIQQLQSEEVSARDDQARYEKMCKSLGLLSGALVVILIY